jgi:hypothetical protein
VSARYRRRFDFPLYFSDTLKSTNFNRQLFRENIANTSTFEFAAIRHSFR